jgi:Domain of unknown function (DUF4845)
MRFNKVVNMRHRQQGITFIGLLLILSLVGVIGYGGIRLIPVYLNFIKVSRTMEQVAKEFKGDNPDPARIRVSLERHWTIEDIAEVTAKDIEVKKDGDSVVLHTGYDHTVPYIGNISLTVSFDKSVTIE